MAGKTPSSQQVAQQRARKKVKTTRSSRSPIAKATRLPRRLLAHKVSRALVNPRRSPRRSQLNMLVASLLNMV